MSNRPLSELFRVTGRFQRSVHLARDFYTENALDGYVLTVTARETLSRVIFALENSATSKAWSLTGPYGSGKSAFALFAAKLLGDAEAQPTQHALSLLEQADLSLHKRFISANGKGPSPAGFCPILVSGERAPITLALLRGLERGLTHSDGTPRSNSSLLRNIEDLLKTADKGKLPHASDITNLFEAATQQICSESGSGLLVVIDELGKFVEYAVQHPEQGDVFVLQSLAEFASRSGETPLLLLTILHQAFEQYARRAAKSQREEWTKIQGRFEDVPFVEPTEQVLRLIGEALDRTSETVPECNLSDASSLGLKPQQLTDLEFTRLLESCLPLHPTVALLIGSFFRRFAQNERSLFAFLSSSEPHGLQDFLATQSYDDNVLPLFRLSNLYDYINTAMGNRLYTSNDGKKWVEIELAIQRLPTLSPNSVKLIKTIGLMCVVGEAIPNLKPSETLLHYAVSDNSPTAVEEFEKALATLEQHSIAVHRRYNKAYQLWEGSDIDIEARVREAAAYLEPNVSLANTLSDLVQSDLVQLKPLVARQHSYKTGTMRYFAIRYVDLDNFNANLEAPLEDADILLLYALPANEFEEKELVKKAKKAAKERVLIAIPKSIGFLRDAVMELVQLRWVSQNTPELEGDATARSELSARLAVAKNDVSSRLHAILGEDSEETCIWYYKGKKVPIRSQRERNKHLSKICDRVYNKTPILRNELINRREISAQVATARRKLIKAMLEHGEQKALGISGYPPEMTIYRSLLSETGMHRKASGGWRFFPPKKRDKMHSTWEAIQEFLNECEDEKQPILKLYERLEAPPLGLRRGPLPILLCAAMLHYKTEIALYENGSFVADVSMPVFERLIKAPEKFELKRFRLAGVRTDVLSQLGGVLKQPAEADAPDLLTIVAPLMRFIAELPKYTLLTQTLSEEAKNLRKTVLDAREPDMLIFEQLPEAMGCPPFRTDATSDANAVDAFFKKLQDALAELGGAYDIRLNSIEQLLVSAFALKQTNEELRRELAGRAESLLAVTVETRLKGFLIRACDLGLDFTGWLEAIATFLANKPPSSWNDTDKAQFEVNLSELARKFHHFEAVSYENRFHVEQPSAGESIRIGITRPNQREQERVVALPSPTEGQAAKLEDAIEEVFEEFGMAENTEHCLAVIARLSEKLMQQLEN